MVEMVLMVETHLLIISFVTAVAVAVLGIMELVDMELAMVFQADLVAVAVIMVLLVESLLLVKDILVEMEMVMVTLAAVVAVQVVQEQELVIQVVVLVDRAALEFNLQ